MTNQVEVHAFNCKKAYFKFNGSRLACACFLEITFMWICTVKWVIFISCKFLLILQEGSCLVKLPLASVVLIAGYILNF